jgi:hypothetical protein
VEIAVIAMRRKERFGHVGFLGLEFLHADHVGVLLAHPLEKPFLAAERMPLRLALIIRNISGNFEFREKR